MSDIITALSTGRVHSPDTDIDLTTQSWKEHPKFKGVRILDAVPGSLTGGRFSAHIVRIDPGCAIGEHIHPDSYELHEVMAGSGTCGLNGRTLDYASGVSAVIPAALPHSVQAGPQGLTLLAKFVPPLG